VQSCDCDALHLEHSSDRIDMRISWRTDGEYPGPSHDRFLSYKDECSRCSGLLSSVNLSLPVCGTFMACKPTGAMFMKRIPDVLSTLSTSLLEDYLVGVTGTRLMEGPRQYHPDEMRMITPDFWGNQ
jgi:hypothetical protein